MIFDHVPPGTIMLCAELPMNNDKTGGGYMCAKVASPRPRERCDARCTVNRVIRLREEGTRPWIPPKPVKP